MVSNVKRSQVCNLESFGPDTQSLADLRLATALGDPSTLGRFKTGWGVGKTWGKYMELWDVDG